MHFVVSFFSEFLNVFLSDTATESNKYCKVFAATMCFFLQFSLYFFSARLIKTNKIYFYHDKNKLLNALFVKAVHSGSKLNCSKFSGVHCFISALRNVLWLCLFILFVVLIFMFVWDVYLLFFLLSGFCSPSLLSYL